MITTTAAQQNEADAICENKLLQDPPMHCSKLTWNVPGVVVLQLVVTASAGKHIYRPGYSSMCQKLTTKAWKPIAMMDKKQSVRARVEICTEWHVLAVDSTYHSLPFVLSTLQDKLHLLLLKLWPFFGHNNTKKLILQAFRCDHEVQQSDLRIAESTSKLDVRNPVFLSQWSRRRAATYPNVHEGEI